MNPEGLPPTDPSTLPSAGEVTAADTVASTDISTETKEKLGTLWGQLVLGTDATPPAAALESNADLKAWLSETITTETDKLIDEWGINRHPELIEQMRQASAEQLPDLQRQYIGAVAEEIYTLKSHQAPGDSHWDSWPAAMRANNRMNCVGHTMLVSNLLQRAGLTVYAGRPINHTLPVTRLDNDEWWLVDSHNGPTQVRQIYPEETDIAGNQTLLIDDPGFDGKIIPLDDPDSLAISAIGNLNALQHDGTDQYQPGVEHMDQARAYLEKHAAAIGDFSFSGLSERLAPNREALWNSPEMQAEKKRIDILHNNAYDGAARKFLRGLPREQAQAVLAEAARRGAMLSGYLAGKFTAPENVSSGLRAYMTALRGGVEQLQAEHPDMVDEYVVRTRTWWEELAKIKPSNSTTAAEVEKPKE